MQWRRKCFKLLNRQRIQGENPVSFRLILYYLSYLYMHYRYNLSCHLMNSLLRKPSTIIISLIIISHVYRRWRWYIHLYCARDQISTYNIYVCIPETRRIVKDTSSRGTFDSSRTTSANNSFSPLFHLRAHHLSMCSADARSFFLHLASSFPLPLLFTTVVESSLQCIVTEINDADLRSETSLKIIYCIEYRDLIIYSKK